MPLDRKAFLDAISCPTEEVEIPGIGRVLVRSLSVEEDGFIRKLAAEGKPEVDAKIAPYILARAVLSADGGRMFTDEEAEKLAAQDTECVRTVALAIRRISKLTPEAVEAEGEPSAAIP
jgi:hypothetical protein